MDPLTLLALATPAGFVFRKSTDPSGINESIQGPGPTFSKDVTATKNEKPSGSSPIPARFQMWEWPSLPDYPFTASAVFAISSAIGFMRGWSGKALA